MAEPPKTPEEYAAFLREMSRGADAAFVIVSAARLEDWLEGTIKANMKDPLPDSLYRNIFKGYGPLSTFSAKIDVGYALELFGPETYADLKAIKEIRNRFAHTQNMLHFDSPELIPDFQRLTGWKKGVNAEHLYYERLKVCIEALKSKLEVTYLIQALKGQPTKEPQQGLLSPSPETSEQPSPQPPPPDPGESNKGG